MTTTDDLTTHLARGLTPVKRQRLAPKMALWLVTFALFEIFALTVVGLRSDISLRLTEAPFIGALAALIAGFVAVSWQTWLSVIPGRAAKRSTLVGLVLVGWAFVALAAYTSPQTAADETGLMEHLFCCLRMVGGAMIPTVILLAMTSRLAPLHADQTVGYTMIAATFSVMIAGQLNCPYESMTHVLIGHGLMVVAVTGLTFWLHRAIFRRLAAANLAKRSR